MKETWGTTKRCSILLVATRARRTVHVEIDGFVTLQKRGGMEPGS